MSREAFEKEWTEVYRIFSPDEHPVLEMKDGKYVDHETRCSLRLFKAGLEAAAKVCDEHGEGWAAYCEAAECADNIRKLMEE